MKVDHQQNHQKYLKEDSQLKIYFCHYHRINNKSQPNSKINFWIIWKLINKDLKNQIIKINKQNNRFNTKLRVFELNFIYHAFLNFISLLICIIQSTIDIFAKKKFKEFIIKPFNIFIARLLMCQLGKNHLKIF